VRLSPYVIHSALVGLYYTVIATVLSCCLAFPIAFIVGILRVSRSRTVRGCAMVYVEGIRGASPIVELYWAFFVLPLIGIRFPPLEVGVLVLGLVGGAYASEAVRGALLAVDRGQWEAGLSLSMSRSSTVLRIVLPQAIPTMLPIFQNVAIDMLKGTSLLSLVTVTELTRTANELGTVGVMSFSSGYGALLVIYFLLSLPIMAGMAKLEKYTARYQSKFVRRPRS